MIPGMARVLITGANRGIGLELTRQLSERGDTVIALCRESTPELDALASEVVTGIDVTEDSGAKKAARELGDSRVDILINNAGIFSNETLHDLDFDEIRRNFEVNALGPLRMTHALQGHLADGAKVIFITSRMGSIEDNGSGAYYGYRMAKAALNMAGVNLAHDLRGKASVAILHPGLVATRMTGFSGVSTEESAAGLIERIDALGPEGSGGFWHANGDRLPW